MPRRAIFLTTAMLALSTQMVSPPALATETRDTATIGLAIEPPGLDPTRGSSEAIGMVTYGNIYEGLLRLGENGQLQPLLASDWRISDDGLSYDFTLRDRVRFHDGTPLTCDIARASLLRAGGRDSTNPDRDIFNRIAGIDCTAPLRMHISLSARYGSFLQHLAWNDAAILLPNAPGANVAHPIGTGPFRLSTWQRGDHITLTRNADYWGESPSLRSATFRFMPDPLSASNALLAGELDAYPSFPSREMLHRFTHDPKLVVTRGSFPFKAILALNNARPPLNDHRVRQAIAQAIDRKALIEAIADGDATALHSHMAPDDPEYATLDEHYPYDPVRARALLREASVPAGTHFMLAFPPIDYARDSSELIAAFLEQVGLAVTLEPMEWPQWLGQVYGHGVFDMTVIAHTEPHDISIYDRERVYFHYRSPSFHALVEQYESTTDATRRHELSRQLQEQLATDEPNVFLFNLPRLSVINRKLEGLWASQPIAAYPLAGAHWAP